MHAIKIQYLGQIQKTWKKDEEITYSHHNIVSKHMWWPKDPEDIIQKQSTQHCCCCCKTAPQQIILRTWFNTEDIFRFHVPEITMEVMHARPWRRLKTQSLWYIINQLCQVPAKREQLQKLCNNTHCYEIVEGEGCPWLLTCNCCPNTNYPYSTYEYQVDLTSDEKLNLTLQHTTSLPPPQESRVPTNMTNRLETYGVLQQFLQEWLSNGLTSLHLQPATSGTLQRPPIRNKPQLQALHKAP
jgi:hypothetical protein